jgi:hypothetical protein
MIGDELGVQQPKSACNQMGDEMDKRDLAGIARPRKHALTKESSPKANPVKAAYKLPLMPSFDTKAVPPAV